MICALALISKNAVVVICIKEFDFSFSYSESVWPTNWSTESITHQQPVCCSSDAGGKEPTYTHQPDAGSIRHHTRLCTTDPCLNDSPPCATPASRWMANGYWWCWLPTAADYATAVLPTKQKPFSVIKGKSLE